MCHHFTICPCRGCPTTEIFINGTSPPSLSSSSLSSYSPPPLPFAIVIAGQTTVSLHTSWLACVVYTHFTYDSKKKNNSLHYFASRSMVARERLSSSSSPSSSKWADFSRICPSALEYGPDGCHEVRMSNEHTTLCMYDALKKKTICVYCRYVRLCVLYIK